MVNYNFLYEKIPHGLLLTININIQVWTHGVAVFVVTVTISAGGVGFSPMVPPIGSDQHWGQPLTPTPNAQTTLY